jgi:hypothetical protein
MGETMVNKQDSETTAAMVPGLDPAEDAGAVRAQDVDLRDGERHRDDMRPDGDYMRSMSDYREAYREPDYRERPYRGEGPGPYRERYAQRGWEDDRDLGRFRDQDRYRDYDRGRYRDDDHSRYRDDDHSRYRDNDGGGDSGFADGASRFARQHIRTGETKEFFKTSEFFVALAAATALIIAAAVQDTFDAPGMWRMFTAIAVAYILSRGIAKAGSSKKEHDGRRGSRAW